MQTVSCNQCTEMEVVDKGHCLINFLSSAKKLFMIIEGAVITDFVGRHCRRRGYPCCRSALFVLLPRKRGYTEYRRIFEKIIFLDFLYIPSEMGRSKNRGKYIKFTIIDNKIDRSTYLCK